MIVSLIVAMDERGGIGKDNRLPWRLSTEMLLFKERTMGHHLIMGRKTGESIGKPLAGRTNIIVTRNKNYFLQGFLIVNDLDEALELAERNRETEIFVIGGAKIYQAALPRADRVYLTRVHAEVDADTFFPPFDFSEWVEVASTRYPADSANEYDFTIQTLSRPVDSYLSKNR